MKHVRNEEGILSRTAPTHKPSPVAGMLQDVNPTFQPAGSKKSPARASASRAGREMMSRSRPPTGGGAQTRILTLQQQVGRQSKTFLFFGRGSVHMCTREGGVWGRSVSW